MPTNGTSAHGPTGAAATVAGATTVATAPHMAAAERGAGLFRASWILPSNPVATRIDREYARQAAINDIGELVKQSAVSLRKPSDSKLTAAQQL